MLFLAVLMLGLLSALLMPTKAGRRPLREAARVAMGVALIVAGASHFAAPDPFIQHLPEWVPSRDGLIALTGAIEILGGLGLMGPRRYQAHVALALAAYLVAVFPANVHVAIAGVDVDGQPGGIYPWLRLAFQPLFIWWVLSSVPAASQLLRRIEAVPRVAR